MKYLISVGNRKLSKETAIFNLTSATNCPMKDRCTFGINKKCYALKAERMYPACLPYRERQAEFWLNNNLEKKIEYFQNFFKHHPSLKYLRVNESGDMTTVADLIQLDELAKALKVSHNIEAYTYTNNIELLLAYEPKYINVNLSVDEGNQITYDNNMGVFKGYNRFKAVPKKSMTKYKVTCLGSDCMSKCQKCLYKKGLVIHVGIH